MYPRSGQRAIRIIHSTGNPAILFGQQLPRPHRARMWDSWRATPGSIYARAKSNDPCRSSGHQPCSAACAARSELPRIPRRYEYLADFERSRRVCGIPAWQPSAFQPPQAPMLHLLVRQSGNELSYPPCVGSRVGTPEPNWPILFNQAADQLNRQHGAPASAPAPAGQDPYRAALVQARALGETIWRPPCMSL